MGLSKEEEPIDMGKVESEEQLLGLYHRTTEAKEEKKRQDAIADAKSIVESAIFGRYGGTQVYGRHEPRVDIPLKELKLRLSEMKLQDVKFEVNQLEKLLLQCRQFPAKVQDAISNETRFHPTSEWNPDKEQKSWQNNLKTVADAIPYIEETLKFYQDRLDELQPLVQRLDQSLSTMMACTEKAEKTIAEIQKLAKETWLNKPEKNIQKIADLLYAWYKESLLFEKIKQQYILGGGLFATIPEFSKNPLDDFLKDSPILNKVERAYMGLIQYHGGV